MYCANCGSELPADALFCPKCGTACHVVLGTEPDQEKTPPPISNTIAKGGIIGWIGSHVGATIAIGIATVAIATGAGLGISALMSAQAIVPESQVTADLTSVDIASLAGVTLSYADNDPYATMSVTDISEQRDKNVPDTVEGTCEVTLENTSSQVIAKVSFTYTKQDDTWSLAGWEVTDKQVKARCGVDSAKVQEALPALMAQADTTAASATSLESIYGTSGCSLLANTTTADGGEVTFALLVDDSRREASGTLTVAFTFENGNWQAIPTADAAAYAVTSKTKLVWVLTGVRTTFMEKYYIAETYEYDAGAQLLAKTVETYGADGGAYGNATYTCENGTVSSSKYIGDITYSNFNYSYTANGLCTGATEKTYRQDNGELFSTDTYVLTYDSGGQLIQSVQNRVAGSTTNTFDYSGEKLIGLTTDVSSGNSNNYTYAYDENGNIGMRTSTSGGTTFTSTYTWQQIEIPADVNPFNSMNIIWMVIV